MSVQIVRWLAHNEPVPEGWRVLCDAPAHHGRHSRLVGLVGARIPKSARAVGRRAIIDAMPRRRWMTCVEIAESVKRSPVNVRSAVRHAWLAGALERRVVAGTKARFEYRRMTK